MRMGTPGLFGLCLCIVVFVFHSLPFGWPLGTITFDPNTIQHFLDLITSQLIAKSQMLLSVETPACLSRWNQRVSFLDMLEYMGSTLAGISTPKTRVYKPAEFGSGLHSPNMNANYSG